jgi:radical SAM superfamily enzyme with C-terminal helix-hairpin-helix motif
VSDSSIEKVRAHFAGLNETTINIPEWDIVATVRPMTIGDKAYVVSRAVDDEHMQMVWLLIRKLKIDGKPVFMEADRLALSNEADENVIRSVALQIMGIEDIAGN